ncbi:MAG: recombinase family protein, partial [Dehalococcoidia bacterium]|nr:recombinase family protein [Dehalococcoidia bacterium]
AVNAQERRTTLRRSADGMARCVNSGHFPGGICSLGYMVEGEKNEARMAPSTRIIWNEWTAADLMRQIYHWLGVEGWSCRKIADHLNALGVPTAYQHLTPGKARGERQTGLQPKWRAGRIRNMVVLTVYKGLYEYGKRSKDKKRGTWKVQVPRLVSDELWQAAQEALARNKWMPKNTRREHLLTGLVKCGDCGKSYCAGQGRDGISWYRCNGRMQAKKNKEVSPCQAKGIKSTDLENIVWHDIEQWLRDPGELLRELQADSSQEKAAAVAEAERTTLRARLAALEEERKGYIRLNAQQKLDDTGLDEFLSEVAHKKVAVEKRLAELAPPEEDRDVIPDDLLAEIRKRLDAGLSEKDRRDITLLLVKPIIVKTKTEGDKRCCHAEIRYRFSGAVNCDTGSPVFLNRHSRVYSPLSRPTA